MCRYCACELSKEQLSKRCAYKKNNVLQDVPWIKEKVFLDYNPSTNLRPQQNCLPVIIDGKHLENSDPRLFVPMYWTLIPSWFKHDFENWNNSTYNARVENLTESKVFSSSLSEGKRCIIVMEGFFECQKIRSKADNIFYLQSTNKDLLKAAGLFTIVKKKGETLCSCTIITTEAKGSVRKVHNRVPLLLNDDADVEAWLDYKTISSNDALRKIKASQPNNLQIYRTAEPGSTEPLDKQITASKSMMSNWLISGKKGVKRKADEI